METFRVSQHITSWVTGKFIAIIINIIMGIFFFVHYCNIQYLVVYYMDICRRLIEIWKQANWNMKTKKKITTILTIIWTNVHIIAALQKKHVSQFFYRWNMSKCENKIFKKFGDTVAIKRVAIFKKKNHTCIYGLTMLYKKNNVIFLYIKTVATKK